MIGSMQMYRQAGFTVCWWSIPLLTMGIFIAMTGWMIYRFRQTRCMTVAQLFELRYSRKLRVTTGFVIFAVGLLNFAIFPAVGARFFQYFLNLGSYVVHVGTLQIDLIYAGVMLVILAFSVALVLMGGQITVIITDFIQGAFIFIVMIAVTVFIFAKLGWSTIGDAMIMASKEGASLVDPL